MSALGQKQTFAAPRDVRFVPMRTLLGAAGSAGDRLR